MSELPIDLGLNDGQVYIQHRFLPRLVEFRLNLHQQSGSVWINPANVAYVQGMKIGMADGTVFDVQMIGGKDIVELLQVDAEKWDWNPR